MTTTFGMSRPPGVDRAPPLLAVNDLAVSFGATAGDRVRAVDGLWLTIHPGQTLAVVGESGCGKSVTAMSVLRLIPSPPGRIDRGAIVFDGRDLLGLDDKQMLGVRGSDIAMIFQEPTASLNPVYSIGNQIVEAVRLHRPVRRAEAIELAVAALRDVGIVHPERRFHDYPHQFSGGMQQRVMIAMALVCQPRLLLADEPTTALDVTIQDQILRLLRDIQRQRHMGIMLITHDLCVVAENADVVCVVYDGRVVEYATVHDLFRTPYHPYTRALLGSIPKLHEHRHRLATVADVVSDPAEFRKLPGHHLGLTAWWPRQAPPEDLTPTPEGLDYTLHEIEPEHWVGCWRTSYLASHPNRPPDVTHILES